MMLALAAQAQDYQEPKRIQLTDEEQALVRSSVDFTFRLFKETRGDISQVISPLSVTYALGMLNNGAAGVTRQEICQTLGFGETGADGINQFCRKMLTEMPALDEQTKVMISNAIFLNQPRYFLPEFLEIAHNYYDAETQTRDFWDGETRNVINKWGSDHTMGMIEEVLDENSFKEDVASYLLNAVYFKGVWTLKFDKEETKDEVFNGKEKVPMMHMRKYLPYSETGDYQALMLPYGNEAYHMTVLLPREGKSIREVLSTLDADTWLWYLQPVCAEAEVDVKLPRMDITTNVNLVETMKDLGMPSAFDPNEADIPGCYNTSQFISNMFQVAKIKVDEEGTEAAAITVIETTDALPSGEPKLYEFHADRPFLYIISERSTGAILFIGQYLGENSVKPTGIEKIDNGQLSIDNEEADIYNLSGQRLSKMQKGINILGGRKILVR
jgi:serpin B